MARVASSAFLAVVLTALWAVYMVGQSTVTPSALVIIGVPSRMSNTIVIGGINLNEAVGVDISALTSNHLSGLNDGFSSTTQGGTKYRQTLRLAQTGTDSFTGGTVKYAKDEQGDVGDFLVFSFGKPVFEYQIEFDSGLSSRVEGSDLSDLEGTDFSFMGAPASIYKATKNGNLVEVRFFSKGGDVQIRDSDSTDADFERSVKVNGRTINAQARIEASVSGNEVRILRITYRFLAYSRLGGDAFIAPKRGIRQFLREPEGLINPSFEIIYGGIRGTATSTVSSPSFTSGGNLFFDPSGGNRYDLIFTNLAGQTIKVPYVTLVSGTPRLGDGDRDLVVSEGSSTGDFNIDPGDYFVTSSSNDVNGLTNIVVYSGVSRSNNEVYFDFLGGGRQTVAYEPSTGHGIFNVGGRSHEVYVDTGSTERVVVDQNDDGSFDGSTARIVTLGGAQLTPGASSTTLRIARRLFDNPPSSDETVTINTFADGSRIDLDVPTQSSLTMHSGSDRLSRGLTNYGVQFTLDDTRTPATLAVDIPRAQRGSSVAAVSGVGRVSKAGQSGAFVVVTLERERFLPKPSGSTSRDGVGVND